MIKVRVHLDGNEKGYLEYTCKETMKQFIEYISEPVHLIGLTRVGFNTLITIPIRRYVVEAWEVDE